MQFLKQSLYSVFLTICLCSCTYDIDYSELCFIGDSITDLWDVELYFPEAIITKIAVSGATIEDAARWNLKKCKGKKTVVLLGTNNIGNVSSDNPRAEEIKNVFAHKYINLIKSIPFESVAVISILPRNLHGKQTQNVNMFIEEQNEANRLLLLKEIPNSQFIDVFNSFLSNGYNINKVLFNDGLHPSPAGYEVLGNKIKGAL